MKRITVLMALIGLCTFEVYSQAGEINRIKLSVEQGEGRLVNLYDLGLVIQTRKLTNCEYTFYDVDLNKSGLAKLTLGSKKEYISNYYYDSLINKILVFHGSKKATNLTLISPDGKSKKTIKLKTAEKKAYISTRLVKLDKKVFAVSNKGKKTFLNTIDLYDGDITPVNLPIEWKTRVILKMSRVNSQYLALFYIDQKVKNKKFQNIALIDEEGTVVADKLLTNTTSDFPFEECSITDIGNDQLAIAGTYSKDLKTIYSIGMFVAKINKLELEYVEYYDYNTIENFYDFMKDKKREKAEKKAKKKASKGKSSRYLAITHPVIIADGRLIVTAEFYYPTYRTETTVSYSNGKPTYSTRQVFDGYQYTHTMVLGINEEGKKDFEHCIPFNLDHKPFYASQKLKRRLSEEEVKYSYISDNKIYSFSIADGELKKNDPETLVEVGDDKKLRYTASSIDSWYENYFYALTVQMTKQKGKVIGGKATNYYLVKYGVE